MESRYESQVGADLSAPWATVAARMREQREGGFVFVRERVVETGGDLLHRFDAQFVLAYAADVQQHAIELVEDLAGRRRFPRGPVDAAAVQARVYEKAQDDEELRVAAAAGVETQLWTVYGALLREPAAMPATSLPGAVGDVVAAAFNGILAAQLPPGPSDADWQAPDLSLLDTREWMRRLYDDPDRAGRCAAARAARVHDALAPVARFVVDQAMRRERGRAASISQGRPFDYEPLPGLEHVRRALPQLRVAGVPAVQVYVTAYSGLYEAAASYLFDPVPLFDRLTVREMLCAGVQRRLLDVLEASALRA